MKNTLNKFVQQISHSSQQVNGTVNIMIPEIIEDIPDEQAIQDIELMHQYEEYMDSWTRVIKDTLMQKSIQEPDTHKTSLNEIEFWRNRHAILSTLQQQLSHDFVATCFRRLDKYLVDNHTTVYEYDQQYKELTRLLGESKEYVKFLSTLERQFKNLATEGLSGVEETLKSLMNGLRLVWTISRHY
jgi:dynein heavy chain